MRRRLRHPSPALLIALIALFAALGGGVYAIGKGKQINGAKIKVKSLPGNRLKPGSVPGNRLAPGAISGASLAPSSITGKQINEATLGPVPNAVHAEKADSATDAETALNSVNAVNATTVNGHNAGCAVGTQFFAGACWQTSANLATTAPEAAVACASKGGALPEALQLAAFSKQPGVTLEGEEWSSDIAVFTGKDVYAVATVTPNAEINSGSVSGGTSDANKFRCVIPLVT
jgi:hypothetical protein